MAYAILFRSSARRDFERLPREHQDRLTERIAALAGDPRPHNAEPFHGVPHGYRIRVGDLRVVYQVLDSQGQVWVFRVGHRKDVYRRR